MTENLYFDASVLQFDQYRGVHVYASTLLAEMADAAPDVQFHLHFGMTGWNPQIDDLLLRPNIRSHCYPGIVGRHLVPPINILRTRSSAYCLLNGNTGLVRTPMPCPTAAVFHDMRLILFPDLYGKQECDAFAKSARKWLPKLKLVITGSHTVKKEIVDYFGICEDRVAVVSEGCEHRTDSIQPKRPSQLPNDKPFFLTVNPSDIRKNLSLTLKAFAGYVDEQSDDQQSVLVIAGVIAMSDEYESWRVANPNAATRTIALGYIDESELVYLYRNALVSIYVSLYEGFGIPVIEAYHQGCPVILSDIPVFREVAGAAGFFVSPTDPLALKNAMVTVRAFPEYRDLQSQAMRDRAGLFRWKESAKVAIDALLSL